MVTPPYRCFPPPHSFLCLHSFLPCYAISLNVFLLFCGGYLGFLVKQTKIVNFFRIQKVEQDAQAAKCRLSQGNSFLPPACTIKLHNLINVIWNIWDHFPSLLVLDDPWSGGFSIVEFVLLINYFLIVVGYLALRFIFFLCTLSSVHLRCISQEPCYQKFLLVCRSCLFLVLHAWLCNSIDCMACWCCSIACKYAPVNWKL